MEKAIVFDLDGTLFDSHSQVIEAFRFALSPFGVHVDEQFLEKIRHRTKIDLFDEVIDDTHTQQAHDRLIEFSLKATQQVKPFEGVIETLNFLEKKKIPLAIWTGRDARSAAEILNYNKIDKKISRIIAGCDVKKNKPHPEGLLRIIDHFGLPPNEILMIGDHEHDILGAKQAGCKSALATWGHSSEEISKNLNPDYKFSNLSELTQYFN